MKLRRRLLFLAGLSVLPAVGLLAYDQVQLRRVRQAEVRHQVLTLAQFQAGDIEGHLRGAQQLLGVLVQHPSVRRLDSAACTPLVGDVKRMFPFYASVTVADTKGDVICSSVPHQNISVADRAHFQQAIRSGRFTIGEYTISRLTHQPVLPLVQPVQDRDGTVRGVVEVAFDLSWLADDLVRKLRHGMVTLVADRDLRILLRFPDNEKFQGLLVPSQYHHFMLSEKPGTIEVTGMDGQTYILGFVPVSYGLDGIYVGVAKKRDAAFAALDRVTVAGFAVVAGSLLLALLTASLVGRRWIAQPVDRLLATADRLRAGDFGARVGVKNDRSELGGLAQALDALAVALDQREQARATADMHRAEAERQLRDLAATLEQRVAERTAALEGANRQLATEIEERQLAESKLVQMQKMEALGQLTGGIAHDFNNLLTAVLGSLELAAKRVTDPSTQRYLATATSAARRGARLTSKMLTFARKQELVMQPVDPNRIILSIDDLLRRTIGAHVTVARDLASGLWPAMADPVLLEAVLLNLALNARDAMPDGGELRFETRNVTLGGAEPPVDGLSPGDYVRIAVRDSGVGMDPEVMARAFEPFFTTKEVGKGTGLGLPQVLGFAQQAGGTATLDSAPGQGTTVAIYLPRATAAADHGDDPPDRPEAEMGPLRILVVDDNTTVRELTQEVLVDLGHEVSAFADPVEALRFLETDAPADLLLVDFAMPRMNGAQLAAAARARRPNLPVLFQTGYAGDDALLPWTDAGYLALRKPFMAKDLSEAVRRTLELARDGRLGEPAIHGDPPAPPA
ncbi:MAG: ATP-binding protein [Acetobacteraceae bacterium]